jgi:hypothetical protein
MPTYPQDVERPTIHVTVSDFRYFVPPATIDDDVVTCEVLPGVHVTERFDILAQWEADLGRSINRAIEQHLEAGR